MRPERVPELVDGSRHEPRELSFWIRYSSLHDFLTLSFLATLILGSTFCSWKSPCNIIICCIVLCKSWQMWNPPKSRIICRKYVAFVARFQTPFLASKIEKLYHKFMLRSLSSGVKQVYQFYSVSRLDFTPFGDSWRTPKAKLYLLKSHNFDCSIVLKIPAFKAAL